MHEQLSNKKNNSLEMSDFIMIIIIIIMILINTCAIYVINVLIIFNIKM